MDVFVIYLNINFVSFPIKRSMKRVNMCIHYFEFMHIILICTHF